MASVDALLVSTSQHLLAVVGDDVRIAHHGSGLYFGIARHDDLIAVACHHQVIRSPSVEELDAQVGSLLLLDRQLREIDDRRPTDAVLRQPHGIASIDGCVWITCSYDDVVMIHDPAAGTWERWEPGRGSGPPKPTHDDRFHYNAIAPLGEDRFRLLAHNYGRSQVLTYARHGRELLALDEVGIGAHDLLDHEGRLVVSSSLEGALRSPDGWVRRVGGMPRGIAASEGGLAMGCSELSERTSRHLTDGRIARFDRRWRPVDDVVLPAVGQVLDLAAVDLDADAFALLPPLPGAMVAPPPPGAGGYQAPIGCPPLAYGEWHDGEDAQQWMAARRAHVPIVINPDDQVIEIDLTWHGPTPATVAVALDGRSLGEIGWSAPGVVTGRFALPTGPPSPAGAGRDALLTFDVGALWQPPGDARHLGAGLCAMRFTT